VKAEDSEAKIHVEVSAIIGGGGERTKGDKILRYKE
jgi:hypothetical protein